MVRVSFHTFCMAEGLASYLGSDREQNGGKLRNYELHVKLTVIRYLNLKPHVFYRRQELKLLRLRRGTPKIPKF